MGLSSRVGVRKCGVAALAAGLLVLLAGCSNSPAPTVVSVKCMEAREGIRIGEIVWYNYELYYWSDASRTYRGVQKC